MTIIDKMQAAIRSHYEHYQDGMITERECLLKCAYECETALEDLCSVDASQMELDSVASMLKGYELGVE